PRLAGIVAGRSGKLLRVAVLAYPLDAEVRGELAANLVTQAQGRGHFRETTAQAALRITPAVEVRLHPGLEDQPLRQEKLVGGVQTQCAASRLSEIAGCLDLEPVGGETFDPEGQPLPARPLAAVDSHAELC